MGDASTDGATIAALFEVVEEMRSTGPGEKTRRFNAALIADYRASGGTRTGEMPPEAVVLLTTRGAKTGIERTVPVGVEEIDGRLVVVASASGSPRHPQWYHNLVVTPDVVVEWCGDTFRATAVVVEGDEREDLFGKVNEVYRAHQAGTSRQFPVIELRRLDA